MSEDLKDRPAVLRRTPRPAPDEKVDPVDYSPAAVAPAPLKTQEPATAGGGLVAVGTAPVSGTPPSGYAFLGQQVDIVSTAATSETSV